MIAFLLLKKLDIECLISIGSNIYFDLRKQDMLILYSIPHNKKITFPHFKYIFKMSTDR